VASVFDVAAAILTRRGPMSHMKLQKLLYYAQAWSLVWEESPLFPDEIEAWINGPVVRAVYEVLRTKFRVGVADLGGRGDASVLTAVESATLDRVLDYYGDKDPQWLSDLSHMESPWQTARIGVAPTERSSQPISHASLAEYYGSL